MSEPRNPGWARTLADVEQAVEHCLATLDRYEQAFDRVLAERQVAPRPAPTPSADEWDAKLKAAAKQADEVDRLLVEQEAVWADWQRRYAAWRRSLEQPPE